MALSIQGRITIYTQNISEAPKVHRIIEDMYSVSMQ